MGSEQFGIYKMPKVINGIDSFLVEFKDQIIEKYIEIDENSVTQAILTGPYQRHLNSPVENQQGIITSLNFNYNGKVKLKFDITLSQVNDASYGSANVSIKNESVVLATKSLVKTLVNEPQSVELDIVVSGAPAVIDIYAVNTGPAGVGRREMYTLTNAEIVYSLLPRSTVPVFEHDDAVYI